MWMIVSSDSMKSAPTSQTDCRRNRPVFGDATVTVRMAELLLKKCVFVVAFSYPVVPQGKARIRAQITGAHSREELASAVEKFVVARTELGA